MHIHDDHHKLLTTLIKCGCMVCSVVELLPLPNNINGCLYLLCMHLCPSMLLVKDEACYALCVLGSLGIRWRIINKRLLTERRVCMEKCQTKVLIVRTEEARFKQKKTKVWYFYTQTEQARLRNHLLYDFFYFR